jgi:riboflavin kinase / FMN adenylyltransferase
MIEVFHDFAPKPEACGVDTTLTLGTFDGVHRGHRRILERVREHATQSGTRAAVVTFNQHPMMVVRPESAPLILTTLDEKVSLFEECGIETVHVLTFTSDVASMSADEFVEKHLIQCLSMRHMIVGYDHHFGKGRGGTHDSIEGIARHYGFTIAVQEQMKHLGQVVNSSAIRTRIADGDIRDADDLLGRDYTVQGTVVHGTGMGKRLGYPTANISATDERKLIPGSGVYAGWIEFGGNRHDAVMSIGGRPTFDMPGETIETHIPEFSGNLYDVDAVVGFTDRIRDLVAFGSSDELALRIAKDIESVKRMQTTYIT